MKTKHMLIMLTVALVSMSCSDTMENTIPRGNTTETISSLEYVPLTRSQAEVADRQGEFGIEFFKAYAQRYKDNIVLSPFLMYGNLCAVSLGLAGDDYRELVTELGFEDVNGYVDDSLADYFNAIREALLSMDESVSVVSSSVIGFPTISLLESYKTNLKSYYGIDVLEGGEDDLGRWIEGLTGQPDYRTHSGVLLNGGVGFPANSIVNVLTFDAKWSNPNKMETRVFTGSDNNSYERGFLTGQGSSVEDLQNNRPTCVRLYAGKAQEEPSVLWLPYGNGAFSFVVMLPQEGEDIGSFIQSLSYEDYQRWYKQSGICGKELTYHIPTIDVTYNADADPCNDALRILGLDSKKARNFERAVADNGQKPVFSFGQGVCMTVSDKGTVAVSYSGQSMVKDGSLGNINPVEFIADRPFVYAIVDVYGTILYMGTVTK